MYTIDVYILYMLIGVISFVFGVRTHNAYIQRQADRLSKHFYDLEKNQKETPGKTIYVMIEKHGESYHIYEENTQVFIGKVKSQKEFFEFLETQFSDTTSVLMKNEYFEVFDS